MAESSIEWTDFTWNPIRARDADGKVGWHCEKVSQACQHCYAEAFNGRRLPNGGTGLPYTRSSRDQVEVYADDDVLRLPLKWKKPRRIFVCSMTDLFGEFVPFAFIDRVFAVMNATAFTLPISQRSKRWHTYQVLTKRPDRAAEYLNSRRPTGRGNHPVINEGRNEQGILRGCGMEVMNAGAGLSWPLSNVWIGTTVENQEWADKRIPHLLHCPAAVRYLSCEPLLGPIDLTRLNNGGGETYDALQAVVDRHDGITFRTSDTDPIHWVIAGGESGREARPMHPDWPRSLRNQCQAAGVPFFFKQWGEWMPWDDSPLYERGANRVHNFDDNRSVRVGKKAAGRLLDGVEWSEFPEAAVMQEAMR